MEHEVRMEMQRPARLVNVLPAPRRNMVDQLWEKAASQLVHENSRSLTNNNCNGCFMNSRVLRDHTCFQRMVDQLVEERTDAAYAMGLTRPMLLGRLGILADHHRIPASQVISFFQRYPNAAEGLIIYSADIWAERIEQSVKEQIRADILAFRRNLIEPIAEAQPGQDGQGADNEGVIMIG